MKRIFSMMLAVTLLFGLFPVMSFALISDEIGPVLEDTGLTEEELEVFLWQYYDMGIDEIENITEIYDALGERINSKNLQQLLADYDFVSKEDLEKFLIENDELEKGQKIEESFTYINYLDFIISFYTDYSTPITNENLNQLLKDFELTMAELEALLKANNDAIENYESIEDLELAVIGYLAQQTLDQFGITEDEMMKLFNHFLSLQIDETTAEEQMNSIMTRLEGFVDFESAEDLTNVQMAELVDTMKELMSFFQIDAKYYLYKDDNKIKELSYRDLITLETTNGADLLIELYNYDGVLLADIILTADLFGSELIDHIKEVEKVIAKPIARIAPKVPKTIKGGKMPNTAGNYVEGAAGGLVLIIGGLFLIGRRFVKHS